LRFSIGDRLEVTLDGSALQGVEPRDGGGRNVDAGAVCARPVHPVGVIEQGADREHDQVPARVQDPRRGLDERGLRRRLHDEIGSGHQRFEVEEARLAGQGGQERARLPGVAADRAGHGHARQPVGERRGDGPADGPETEETHPDRAGRSGTRATCGRSARLGHWTVTSHRSSAPSIGQGAVLSSPRCRCGEE
jgi:hypothetical protein